MFEVLELIKIRMFVEFFISIVFIVIGVYYYFIKK